MRHSIRWGLAALAIAGSCPAYAQEQRPVVPLNHLPALAGDYFQLHSQHAQHLYHVYVRLPHTRWMVTPCSRLSPPATSS